MKVLLPASTILAALMPGIVTSKRIIGGTPSAQDAFPFHAASLGDESGFCGGTLVHEDLVLTAAQCAGLFEPGIMIGGTNRTARDGLIRTVTEEITHACFDFPANDIMLLKVITTSVGMTCQRPNDFVFRLTSSLLSLFFVYLCCVLEAG